MQAEIKHLTQVRETLAALFAHIPNVQFEWTTGKLGLPAPVAEMADFTVRVNHGNRVYDLAGNFKENGFPQQLRQAIDQLIRYRYKTKRSDALIVCAPYISAEAARMCREDEVSYFDLAGNCRIALDQLYVERTGIKNPFAKNVVSAPAMYGTRGERILRVLLMNPGKVWRVAPLAKITGASTGTVSILRKLLRERDWAKDTTEGLRLTQPQKLLHDWAQVWRRRAHRPFRYFSRAPLEMIERQITAFAREHGGKAALTGAAGAWRVAPMTRYQRSEIYWDGDPDELAKAVGLKPAEAGANVHLLRPRDRGVFDFQQEFDGVTIVCPVQLYLDLHRDPARGEEAAEHILNTVLFHA